MYTMNGDTSEIILMQNNKSDDGHVWILGLGSFSAIGFSNSHMQAFTIVLTNKFSMSMVQIPDVATVKVKLGKDGDCS